MLLQLKWAYYGIMGARKGQIMEVRVNIPMSWFYKFIVKSLALGGIPQGATPNFDGTYQVYWKFADIQKGTEFYEWTYEISAMNDQIIKWWMNQDVRWKKPGHESSKYLW